MKRTIIGVCGAAALMVAASPPATAASARPASNPATPVICLLGSIGTSLGIPNLLGAAAARCGAPAPTPDPGPGPITPPEPSDPKPIE